MRSAEDLEGGGGGSGDDNEDVGWSRCASVVRGVSPRRLEPPPSLGKEELDDLGGMLLLLLLRPPGDVKPSETLAVKR